MATLLFFLIFGIGFWFGKNIQKDFGEMPHGYCDCYKEEEIEYCKCPENENQK